MTSLACSSFVTDFLHERALGICACHCTNCRPHLYQTGGASQPLCDYSHWLTQTNLSVTELTAHYQIIRWMSSRWSISSFVGGGCGGACRSSCWLKMIHLPLSISSSAAAIVGFHAVDLYGAITVAIGKDLKSTGTSHRGIFSLMITLYKQP